MFYQGLLKISRKFYKNSSDNQLNEIDEKIIISLLGAVTCFIQSVLTYVEGLRVVSSLLLATSFLIFVLLRMFKLRFISEGVFSHFSCVLFSILLISINIVSGVLYSPSKIWIGLLPIFSIVYTGVFSGTMYTFFSTLFLYVISVFYMNGILNYNEFSFIQIQAMGTRNLLFAPFLFLIFFGYYFSKTKYLLKTSAHLAEMGASYSLFVHEISKPLTRLIKDKHSYGQSEDLKSLFDLYSMMTYFNTNNLAATSLTEIDLHKLLQDVLSKYSDYLEHYKISVVNQVNGFQINKDRKMLYVLFDNILRNAIENARDFPGEYSIEILQNNNIITIQNPINPLFAVGNVDLLTIGKTSKEGHMGVGIFLIKKIALKLGLSSDVEISSKKFVFKIDFN